MSHSSFSHEDSETGHRPHQPTERYLKTLANAKKVRAWIHEHPGSTREEIEKGTKITGMIAYLQSKGLIKSSEGPKKGQVRWFVVKK